MTAEFIFIGNDMAVALEGLQDAVSEAYINDAVVTCNIKDKDDESVIAGSGSPITLAYVVASDGIYRGVIQEEAALTAGVTYIVEINVDAGSDLKAKWRYLRAAKHREP